MLAQVGRSVPRDTYYLAKAEFYAGEYRAAERGFQQSLRSGSIRIGTVRWIDSICYYSMLGEIYYHRGQLKQSLDLHEQALSWHVQNRDWLARIQYPAIPPETRPIRAAIAWGVRPTILGDFPPKMSSLEGSFNLEQPFQVGGAVNPAHLRSVDAVEVVRCLAISLKRRAELLGPTAALSPLSSQLSNTLAGMAAPTGHWSSAWVEVLYGLALLGEGQTREGLAHLATGTTAGNVDHPLTGIALLERGKALLRDEEYAAAMDFLQQASVAAAQFGQAEIVEEAFAYLTDAFLANGGKGIYPAVNSAILYAERETFTRLAASLRLGAAEIAVYANDPVTANTLLNQARVMMARRELIPTDLGGRLAYLDAITQYRAGATKAANQSIKLALAYMQRGSIRRFHLALVEALYAVGRRALSPRQMEILYSRVLREPRDEDWRAAPLETITMLLSPHTGSLERWFELLVARKEYDEAVRVGEHLKRHRFYSTLPFGGRILSLRWLVEGDQAMLGRGGMDQQNHLRQKYPSLPLLSRESQRIQLKLRELPLVPTDEDQQKQQRALLGELVTTSSQQENIIREIALRREPARLVFPPQPSLSAVQKAMTEQQAVLMFVTTSKGWHAWFIRRTMDEYWDIKSPAKVRRSLTELLRSIGNRNANGDVSLKDLASEDWKKHAKQIWTDLIGELPSHGWDDLDELVIVPDGVLWHLPFELLQVPAEQLEDVEEDATLISHVRLRYSPTVSLSVGDSRGHRPDLKTTLVGGQLFPRESSQHASEMLATLKGELPDLEVVGKKRPWAAGGYVAGQMDRLIAWNDIAVSGPYAWSPAQFDRGKPHSTLAEWLEYPWGAPDQILLPGYHTAAESSLGKKATGYDIFLTACAMMSTGTRTILLSRWRTGGKMPAVLVREFARELPHAAASQAWQRAVEVGRIELLDPTLEPRVRGNRNDGEVSADHPFLWAGYLLLDTGAEVQQDTVENPAEPKADVDAEEDEAAGEQDDDDAPVAPDAVDEANDPSGENESEDAEVEAETDESPNEPLGEVLEPN